MDFIFKDDYNKLINDYDNYLSHIDYDIQVLSHEVEFFDSDFIVGTINKKNTKDYFFFLIEAQEEENFLHLFIDSSKNYLDGFVKENFEDKILDLMKQFNTEESFEEYNREDILEDIENQISLLPALNIGNNDFFSLIYTIHAKDNIEVCEKEKNNGELETIYISKSDFYCFYSIGEKDKLSIEVNDWLNNILSKNSIPLPHNIKTIQDYIETGVRLYSNIYKYNENDFGRYFSMYLEGREIEEDTENYIPQKKEDSNFLSFFNNWF